MVSLATPQPKPELDTDPSIKTFDSYFIKGSSYICKDVSFFEYSRKSEFISKDGIVHSGNAGGEYW